MEPLFADPREEADLSALVGRLVPACFVRRTRVPYTHSHLHMIKIDCETPPTRESVLTALRKGRRLLTSAVAVGLSDTGRLQEYFRDIGRRRGDRPEVFVWEESVAVTGRSLVLMADVSPDAAPIPDLIDAIRLRCRPPALDSSTITDRALGHDLR